MTERSGDASQLPELEEKLVPWPFFIEADTTPGAVAGQVIDPLDLGLGAGGHGGAMPTYYDAWARTLPFSVYFDTQGARHLECVVDSGGAAAELYFVTYLRCVAATGTATSIARIRGGGADQAELRILANGHFQTRAWPGPGNPAEGQYVFAAGQAVRVEWRVTSGLDNVAARQEVRVFSGPNIEGTNPDDVIIGATSAQVATFNAYRFGMPAGPGGAYAFDHIGFGGLDWLGPIDDRPAPGPSRLAAWDGSQWVQGSDKAWDGFSWLRGKAKVWNGAEWLE